MKRATGFTLIEVIVALTIASLVIVAAYQIFSGVADGARAIAAARESLDRSANGRRWLKSTFLSLEPPFEGRLDRSSFMSWELVPGGWFEPQSITLRLDGDRLVAHANGSTVVLGTGVTDVAFDYLLEPGADTKWVSEWMSPVSAPIAVRLRIARCGKRNPGCVDTLLFLVKERG